jgi:hypothetical protein
MVTITFRRKTGSPLGGSVFGVRIRAVGFVLRRRLSRPLPTSLYDYYPRTVMASYSSCHATTETL